MIGVSPASAIQQREIVASQSRGFVEVALAEGGPSATFAQCRQHDFKARGFEHLDGGHADMRFVIAHERVVPKHDPAAKVAGRVLAFGKPMIKPLPRKLRQRTSVGDAPEPAVQDSNRE